MNRIMPHIFYAFDIVPNNNNRIFMESHKRIKMRTQQ